MHVEQVSETGGVDGRHEDLAEDGLVEVLVDWNLAVPECPLVLFDAPVVIIAEAAFWELDFDQ